MLHDLREWSIGAGGVVDNRSKFEEKAQVTLKPAENRKYRHVAVNERGHRMGETHPRAKLTDHDVDLIRDLCDDLRKTMSRRKVAAIVAEKFEISRRYVDAIYYCEKRAQTLGRFKAVKS